MNEVIKTKYPARNTIDSFANIRWEETYLRCQQVETDFFFVLCKMPPCRIKASNNSFAIHLNIFPFEIQGERESRLATLYVAVDFFLPFEIKNTWALIALLQNLYYAIVWHAWCSMPRQNKSYKYYSLDKSIERFCENVFMSARFFQVDFIIFSIFFFLKIELY